MAVPLLSPASDDVPCPRVTILVDSLPAGAAKATVWRTVEGQRSPVRGALNIAVSGVVSAVDFEAPLDIDVAYQVQVFSASGTELSWTETATTQVISPRWNDGRPRVLVHNPLDPRTAMWVRFESEAVRVLSRPVPGETRWAEGSRLGLMQVGRRRGMVKVALPVITETAEDADKFDALFGTPDVQRLPILCFRIPVELRRTRLPAVFFGGVLEPTAELHPATDLVVWRLVADQVAPPVPALVMPLLRRRDIAAYYATRQAVKDGNASRLALARRYEIAGAGGS